METGPNAGEIPRGKAEVRHDAPRSIPFIQLMEVSNFSIRSKYPPQCAIFQIPKKLVTLHEIDGSFMKICVEMAITQLIWNWTCIVFALFAHFILF
jgi:hypothetical protein